MTDYCLLYITTKDPTQAKNLAKVLLESKLIACANLIPKMESMYVWNGEMTSDEESILLLKTKQDCVDKIIELVDEHHSYDTPCVLSFRLDAGHPKFLQWLDNEISGN